MPTTYATLKATVLSQHVMATDFLFDPTAYGSTALATLLDAYPLGVKSIALSSSPAPATDETAQTVSVSGYCATLAGCSDVYVVMIFFISGGEAQVAIKLQLGSTWTFVSDFPSLAESVFDDVSLVRAPAAPPASGIPLAPSDAQLLGPQWVFASIAYRDALLPDGNFVQGLNFWCQLTPSGDAFGSLQMLLQSFATTTAVGPVMLSQIAPTQPPNLALRLGVSSTLSHLIPILKNGVDVSLVSVNTLTSGRMAGLVLSTEFDFGTNKALTVSCLIQPWLTSHVYFRGSFIGIELPSPAKFAHDFEQLIGAADLVSSLPSDYANAAFSLKSIGIGFELSPTPSVSGVDIALGNADTPWNLDGFASVDEVSISASVQSPFDSAQRQWAFGIAGQITIPAESTSIVLAADAQVLVAPNQPTSYAVTSRLAADSTLPIPIGELVSKWVGTRDLVPDFALSQLGVQWLKSTATGYSFRAVLDTTAPPTFTFGGTKAVTITAGMFEIVSVSGAPATGSVMGAIDILGRVESAFSYSMPGGFRAICQIPSFEIDTASLVADLVGGGWTAPGWFPAITFPQTSLYVGYDAGRSSAGGVPATTFALRAQPSFGTIVFQVVKRDTWAFAAGLALTSPKIAAFDGLSALSCLDDVFAVSELLFVFASGPIADFQFPPATSFGPPSGTTVALPAGIALQAGFFFYGKGTLNLAAMPELGLAQSLFGLGGGVDFDVTAFIATDPTDGSYAQVDMSGVVTINRKALVAIEGALGARAATPPSVYVEGIVTTNVSSTTLSNSQSGGVTGAVAFALMPTAAYLSVSLIGSVTFGPLTVSDFVLVVGIDDADIPSLGFSIQLDLQAYGATYDSSLSLFFDSGDPANSLIAGAVSNLNLSDVITTLVGVITDGADQPPQWLADVGKKIALTGKTLTTVPLATAADLDARNFANLNTAFQSLGVSFGAQTTLIVGPKELGVQGAWYITDIPATGPIAHYALNSEASCITVALEPQFYYCMPPNGGGVVLGPPGHGITFARGVALSGTLQIFFLEVDFEMEILPSKGLSVDVNLEGPLVLVKDFIQLTADGDATKGPEFNLVTYTQGSTAPHLYISGAMTFIGLSDSVFVNIDSNGLLIDLNSNVGTSEVGAAYTVRAYIDDIEDFALAFTGAVYIKSPNLDLGPLGSLDLELNLSVGLSFGAVSGTPFLKCDDVAFDFEGASFTIPGFTLDLRAHDLTDLPGILFDDVKDLIVDFLKDPEQWLKCIGDGVISGVEDVESVLDDVYHVLSSVWSSERRIVVAIHENFVSSNSSTITITPAQPVGAVTQAMIDDATAWADATLQNLVANAICKQIEQTPPEDIGDFKVASIENIDETYSLDQNTTWLMHPQGPLPTLAALGIATPAADPRFFTTVAAPPQFATNVCIIGDFDTVLSNVKVVVTYGGKALAPYTFTSNAGHTFTAPWSTSGALFSLQYTVTYMNGAPPVQSTALPLAGAAVDVIVPVPAAAAA